MMATSIRTRVDIIERLYRGSHTIAELAEMTNVSVKTVYLFVKMLHRRNLAHISGWKLMPTNKMRVAQYSFGEHPDAPRNPKPAPPESTQPPRPRPTPPGPTPYDAFYAICRPTTEELSK